MKDSILMAIESLCDDIATNESAEDNHKRAVTIAMLTVSGLILPEEGELLETTDEEADEPTAPAMSDKLPKPGEHFNYKGKEFVALGVEQGGLLAVVAHELDEEYAFDEDNKNDWRISSLRKLLNGDYLEEFDKNDLFPFVSDLTADDGTTDYGTSEDYIFLLSDNLRRKYRAYIPKYDNWVWSITPYSCLPSYASTERFVYLDGSLNSGHAICAVGAAPACLFNPKIFE